MRFKGSHLFTPETLLNVHGIPYLSSIGICLIVAWLLLTNLNCMGCSRSKPQVSGASSSSSGPAKESSSLQMQGVVQVGQAKLEVAFADTEDDQALGLMFIRHLPEDQGMLFRYPHAQILNFWMKNTFIPLSIGFIDEHNILFQVVDMEPFRTYPTYQSLKPAKYALEVNQGWFTKHGVSEGDRLIILDE